MHFQLYFELIGVVAFAISGAVLGSRKGMDLFGVAMMGMTTAVGGGILRDVLLGLTPPAALRDPLQALVGIAVSLVVFIVIPIACAYPFFQRYVVAGLTIGSVKG